MNYWFILICICYYKIKYRLLNQYLYNVNLKKNILNKIIDEDGLSQMISEFISNNLRSTILILLYVLFSQPWPDFFQFSVKTISPVSNVSIIMVPFFLPSLFLFSFLLSSSSSFFFPSPPFLLPFLFLFFLLPSFLLFSSSSPSFFPSFPSSFLPSFLPSFLSLLSFPFFFLFSYLSGLRPENFLRTQKFPPWGCVASVAA